MEDSDDAGDQTRHPASPCLLLNRGAELFAPRLRTHHHFFGGIDRTRTCIVLIDNQPPDLSTTIPWCSRMDLNHRVPVGRRVTASRNRPLCHCYVVGAGYRSPACAHAARVIARRHSPPIAFKAHCPSLQTVASRKMGSLHGVERQTSRCLLGEGSRHLSAVAALGGPESGCGGWGRTSDRRIIDPVLYRLSYTTVSRCFSKFVKFGTPGEIRTPGPHVRSVLLCPD